MNFLRRTWILAAAAALAPLAAAPPERPAPPRIQKLGSIECDVVEATPIVVQGRLYYFQAVRPDYAHKQPGLADPYFRFWDVEEDRPTPAFAAGFHLGSAVEVGDAVHVFGVAPWGASRIHAFRSRDLAEWETSVALDLPGWAVFNNSVCKAPNRFVMAFEINAPPEETGAAFTTRFAESRDLREWKLLPAECVYAKDRYTACPSLRFVDGWFYMTYLEAKPGPRYETYIVRSKELIEWELSPFNPVLARSDLDRKPANPRFTREEKERLAKAVNVNNSDLDFCEHRGRTILLYSWGNQLGVEHLAHAVYEGGMESFLKGWFPSEGD